LTLDPFMAGVRDGVGRVGWAKVAGAVGSSTVVMANVLGEHDTPVPLADDHHAVSEFGSEGADKPFGDTVRPRTPWGNPDHLDAHIGQNSVERCGALASPVSDEDPELGEAIAKIHHQGTDLLGGPSAVGVGGRASRCPDRLGTSRTKNT
jgi:hypothetical protein